MEEAKGERERGRSKDRSGRGAKKREGREERRLIQLLKYATRTVWLENVNTGYPVELLRLSDLCLVQPNDGNNSCLVCVFIKGLLGFIKSRCRLSPRGSNLLQAASNMRNGDLPTSSSRTSSSPRGYSIRSHSAKAPASFACLGASTSRPRR